MKTPDLETSGMDDLLSAAAAASDLNERSRLISAAAARHLSTAADPADDPLSVPPLEAVIDDFPAPEGDIGQDVPAPGVHVTGPSFNGGGQNSTELE